MRKVILLTLISTMLATLWPVATAYEKRINCGGEDPVLGPGDQVYDADVAYDGTDETAGFVGGVLSTNGDP